MASVRRAPSTATPRASSRRARDARSTPRRARVSPRALDAARDVVVVTGALERLAQTSAVELKRNEKSSDVRVVEALPREAFEGVRNPRDVRSTTLVYPHAKTLEMLDEQGVETAELGETLGGETATRERTTCVIFAEESSKKLKACVETFCEAIDGGRFPRLRRVVLMSRIGVERRDVDPFKYMNRKTFRGGAPLDDCVACEDMIRRRAAKTVKPGGVADGWTFTIVRTGELRGNGPTSKVVQADYALTLVDNAFDVRMQDIDIDEGDKMPGGDFTKRLSAAVFANRTLTTSRYDVLNAAYSIVSTGPAPRERRKGYDVAKGKSPPPVSDREIDEALAPGDEDAERVPGAVPVPS